MARRPRYRRSTAFLVLLCLTAPARAADPAPAASQPAEATPPIALATAKPPEPYNLLTTKKLTGDWGGARTALENVGFTIDPMVVGVYGQNYLGGLNTHNGHDISGKWHYNFELDFQKMGLVPGASFFFRAIQSWNDGVQADVGSLTAPHFSAGSSGDFYIGDPNCILVDKWWYRQRLFDDRIEIRLGKLLNATDLFDSNVYTGNYLTQFMNKVFYGNPALPNRKGIGAYIKVWPTDWLYFSAAVLDPDARPTRTGFDTAFHGEDRFFVDWEFGLAPKWKTARGIMPGNYRFGSWYDPKVRPIFKNTLGGDLPSDSRTGDVGFYVSFDQMVYKENDNPKDKQGLGAFFRYGFMHPDVNRLNHFWSVGSQYEGLVPTRNKDLVGFGVAQSILSKTYRHEINSHADRETVYEMYYAFEVTPWCVVTPDIQVITNPGGNKEARDALVGGVRVKISF